MIDKRDIERFFDIYTEETENIDEYKIAFTRKNKRYAICVMRYSVIESMDIITFYQKYKSRAVNLFYRKYILTEKVYNVNYRSQLPQSR